MAHGHGTDWGGWMSDRFIGALWGAASYIGFLVVGYLAHWIFGADRPPTDGFWFIVLVGAIIGSNWKWIAGIMGVLIFGNVLNSIGRRSPTPQAFLGVVAIMALVITAIVLCVVAFRKRQAIATWTRKQAVMIREKGLRTPFKGWVVVATIIIGGLFVWLLPQTIGFVPVVGGLVILLLRKFGAGYGHGHNTHGHAPGGHGGHP